MKTACAVEGFYLSLPWLVVSRQAHSFLTKAGHSSECEMLEKLIEGEGEAFGGATCFEKFVQF
ncbi:MAG: hypothetical protein KC545_08560, partial [Nitrospira sp.]|nr:hypothetical protein [Nitrospira sp.]